jgi:hypothetical protein
MKTKRYGIEILNLRWDTLVDPNWWDPKNRRKRKLKAESVATYDHAYVRFINKPFLYGW